MAKVGMAVGVIGSTSRAALWVALWALTLGAAVVTSRHAFAQDRESEATVLAADELSDLVGPIALYPDDLVAIVLPASTYPLQVVQAQRYLDSRAKDSSVQPNEDWDDSIVALLNYPDVVKLLNDDLDWTWKLGDAVINQRADVLDAVQGFRDRALAAGNLRSDDRQRVERTADAIAIKPANPEVIYVPYYEPERVVVVQSAPVYHYYPVAYPVYYYPYPVGYHFGVGSFWGVTNWFSIGWGSHAFNVHDYHYHGHPYFGRGYYDPWYVRRGWNVSLSRGSYVWEPQYRRGGQPFTRSDGRRVVTNPGYRRGTDPRDVRAVGSERRSDGGARSTYRNGDATVDRSGTQSRQDPRVTRDRGDSNDASGVARGSDPRVERQRSGSSQSGSVVPTERSGGQRAPDAARQTDPRVPGQYRQRATEQRLAVPRESSEAPSTPPRTFGGIARDGGSSRGDERAAPQRSQQMQPRATEQRAAPTYRGGGAESRGGGQRNTDYSGRGGRATERQ